MCHSIYFNFVILCQVCFYVIVTQFIFNFSLTYISQKFKNETVTRDSFNVLMFFFQFPAVRNVKLYTCCPDEPYVDLSFTIVFRRRSTFYNYILILPCILLTSLTLVLFWIPPESPAKMMLGKNWCEYILIVEILASGNTETHIL